MFAGAAFLDIYFALFGVVCCLSDALVEIIHASLVSIGKGPGDMLLVTLDREVVIFDLKIVVHVPILWYANGYVHYSFGLSLLASFPANRQIMVKGVPENLLLGPASFFLGESKVAGVVVGLT